MLATNLAVFLAQATPDRVVALDLDLLFGHMPLLLDVLNRPSPYGNLSTSVLVGMLGTQRVHDVPFGGEEASRASLDGFRWSWAALAIQPASQSQPRRATSIAPQEKPSRSPVKPERLFNARLVLPAKVRAALS